MENGAARGPAAHLTVLFADISDSSLMYAMRGDTIAFALTTKCVTLMMQHVRHAGGRVLKRVGDGIIAVFERAAAAVQAAAEIERALNETGSDLRHERMHVRVGLSAGRAVVTEGDVFGDVVNVAARLEAYAGPGEIVLSGAVYDELPEDLRGSAILVDQLVLRGRPSVVLVYRYLWKPDDATATAHLQLRAVGGTLALGYGEHSFVLDAERPKLRIGRAADNDIHIEQDVVSRYHAEIGLRGDKFFLRDSSTNGTYVQADGTEPLRVLREDLLLVRAGDIRPGSEDIRPIRYQVRPSR